MRHMIVTLVLLIGCSTDDGDDEERIECESFFIAADVCIDEWSTAKGTWDDVSTCLSDCYTTANFCAKWPQNERAEYYSEQLDDDCELFARRWETACAGGFDDMDAIWTTRAQLYDACVSMFLHGTTLPPAFDACAHYPEFTNPPQELCEP